MQYQATAQYIRVAPRKVRLVADVIRKMAPNEAVLYLKTLSKHASEPLAKVISSALANAKVKNASADTLIFKTIEVMGGPAMKRWQPVAKGSAHAYKKRMTHIRVILVDRTIDSQKNISKTQVELKKPVQINTKKVKAKKE
jgi:large subunit ribosomal protein L22